ncbi:MAG: P1 family peptidase, partial [Chromatiaceae bacterium]|nr:P1 family peptidase [Chromatiaceae bacterium]
MTYSDARAPKPGLNNLITDVPGIEVGHYAAHHTGTTVILARGGAVGGVDVRGSAPGTRETDLLDPVNLVDRINAIVLSGGSAFGLAAADGVMVWLEDRGLGWPLGDGHVIPIVPAAVLFDPGRFGREFRDRPTAEFGRRACENLTAGIFPLGNVGAGAGTIAGGIKGGLGSASIDLGQGVIVGALVAVNPFGNVVNPKTGELFGAYLGIGDEFGPLPRPSTPPVAAPQAPQPIRNTTIGVVATNLELTRVQATKLAQMAQDGLARAISPAHTLFDGDTLFSLATGQIPLATLQEDAAWGPIPAALIRAGAAAADTLTRAIVHAILNADTVGDTLSYRDRYLPRG